MEYIYDEIHQYVANGTYPPAFDKAAKRELRSKSKRYQMKADQLYYDNRRWIESDDERQQLVMSMHSDNLSGHFGRDKRETRYVLGITGWEW